MIFPSHFQRSFRANPCIASLRWSGWVGYAKQGKTTGMPPLTGSEPSKGDFEDTKMRSESAGFDLDLEFHERIVAPYQRISTVGSCKGYLSVHRETMNSGTVHLCMTKYQPIFFLFKWHGLFGVKKVLVKLLWHNLLNISNLYGNGPVSTSTCPDDPYKRISRD